MKRTIFDRLVVGLAAAIVACSTLVPRVNGADDPPKDDKESGKHTWNDVAESIFKKFDAHVHKFLGKAEFNKANAALDKVIRQLIQQGEIGQAPPADGQFRRHFGQKPDAKAPEFQPTFATADTDGNGKVTQAEFTTYVNAAIQAADLTVQAQNANSQNQNNQPAGRPIMRGHR